MAIDPLSLEILILTKREILPTLYAAPFHLQQQNDEEITTLTKVVSFSLPVPTPEDLVKKGVYAIHAHMPTAMDMSQDGTSLVKLCGYLALSTSAGSTLGRYFVDTKTNNASQSRSEANGINLLFEGWKIRHSNNGTITSTID